MVKKRTIIDWSILLFICLVVLLGMFWPRQYPSDWWKYIHEDRADKMENLISSKKINLEERINGYTPLLYAIYRNQFKIAKLLVLAGANVNVVKDGVTPLCKATGYGDLELIKLMLEKGADPNFGTKEGGVPLDWARNDKVASLLIEYGAKVNVPDKIDGNAPLSSAKLPDSRP